MATVASTRHVGAVNGYCVTLRWSRSRAPRSGETSRKGPLDVGRGAGRVRLKALFVGLWEGIMSKSEQTFI